MRSAQPDRERGSVTLETAILWPSVFLLIFGIVHGAIWFHARGIALAAAQEGVRTASVSDGAGGSARAAEFIAEVGADHMMQVSAIEESTDGFTVTVTVVGESNTLIPGWKVAVEQSATAPIRRWTDP